MSQSVVEQILEKEYVQNSVVGYNNTLDEDPLVNDIIRSKDFTTNERAVLIHEQDIPSFSVQANLEQPVQNDAVADLDYDTSNWSGMNSSNVIISDDTLNPNVSHDMEILRQHVWKENDAFKDMIYTDEEEREEALNFLKNRSVSSEEPFTDVVSKAKKKNMRKGILVHNTRSRGRVP
ncbi:hypothetical protein L195_g055791 [Trifolium pratense]|uniref:Uncharacterized protein n=2 Tax=Trifolium pratense TaxID=57577 RepID=A0A2K3K4U4_TRIPR|nr:hypothetical protein L195_g052382 [Trifolium pratense]PNX61519.1 hypothetical protein L195_g052498 [Trifolium pratense]PNX67746.1 hypothetical protein L195_g055791 [Trifolium pratense]